MSFIERYLRKSPGQLITEVDLETFIQKRIPEGLDLEYKNPKILDNPDAVGLSISAMANSAGGLLIVGVQESREGKHRYPGSIIWDENEGHTQEWFESVTLRNIRPPIAECEIYSIRSQGKGIVFLVNIPASSNPPHMAPDRRYHYRNGSSNLIMEHYQVADAYGKRRHPILIPTLVLSQMDIEKKEFNLTLYVTNNGHAIAKWPLIQLQLTRCTFDKEVKTGLWGIIRKSEDVNDLGETSITVQSPIEVIHKGMKKPYGPFKMNMERSGSFVMVLLAAEEAETRIFRGFFSVKWLSKQSITLNESIDIPLWDDALKPPDDYPKELYVEMADELTAEITSLGFTLPSPHLTKQPPDESK